VDEVTIEIAMRDLDTLTDLTDYLSKKERLVRSGQLISAAGEEELIAEYMTRMNESGVHDFTRPDGKAWRENDRVTYDEGHYATLTTNAQYLQKKKADQISYVWDRLITLFTDPILSGTSVVPAGQPADVQSLEVAVREMALLSRFERRLYGKAFLEALEQGQGRHRFMRAVLPGKTETKPRTGFFIVTLAVPDFELKGGYEQYRGVRLNILETYAYELLRQQPLFSRIVGIAAEPKPPVGQSPGSSEDLICLERPHAWTQDLLDGLEERKKAFDIGDSGNIHLQRLDAQEFPRAQTSTLETPGMNRKQRRAERSEKRRRLRKLGL
jgi:hypothetical protein